MATPNAPLQSGYSRQSTSPAGNPHNPNSDNAAPGSHTSLRSASSTYLMQAIRNSSADPSRGTISPRSALDDGSSRTGTLSPQQVDDWSDLSPSRESSAVSTVSQNIQIQPVVSQLRISRATESRVDIFTVNTTSNPASIPNVPAELETAIGTSLQQLINNRATENRSGASAYMENVEELPTASMDCFCFTYCLGFISVKT